MTPWKRGLLNAWLALSLLWAAVAIYYSLSLLSELLTGWDGLLLVVRLILVFLPVAALPPMAILGIGLLVIWIAERLFPPR